MEVLPEKTDPGLHLYFTMENWWKFHEYSTLISRLFLLFSHHFSTIFLDFIYHLVKKKMVEKVLKFKWNPEVLHQLSQIHLPFFQVKKKKKNCKNWWWCWHWCWNLLRHQHQRQKCCYSGAGAGAGSSTSDIFASAPKNFYQIRTPGRLF